MSRPAFSAAWAASMRIDDPDNSAAKVAQVIGGKAEIVKYPPSHGGTLVGKEGVILFEVSGWSNADGQATLFNGRACHDHCYFNAPEANYRTDRAHFWSLP